jgi:WAS/WASL-interacting protein
VTPPTPGKAGASQFNAPPPNPLHPAPPQKAAETPPAAPVQPAATTPPAAASSAEAAKPPAPGPATAPPTPPAPAATPAATAVAAPPAPPAAAPSTAVAKAGPPPLPAKPAPQRRPKPPHLPSQSPPPASQPAPARTNGRQQAADFSNLPPAIAESLAKLAGRSIPPLSSHEAAGTASKADAGEAASEDKPRET